jgi:ubiquinone/menaquinone biosynthesis C-methylase UbiE
MSAEFDNYAAAGYGKLLEDPLRQRFGEPRFFFERKLALLLAFCERHGKGTQSASWLDVGCGEGTLLQIGKKHFGEVAGCDISAGMIRGSDGLNIRHQASPRQIPFTERSFDFVTAVCVYHHVDIADQPFLTLDISRVLKPNGLFCIIEHNPFNPITRLIVRRSPLDSHAQLLTAGKTKRLARAAQMKVLATSYFLYFPERLYSKMAAAEEILSQFPLGGQYAVLCQNPLKFDRPPSYR